MRKDTNNGNGRDHGARRRRLEMRAQDAMRRITRERLRFFWVSLTATVIIFVLVVAIVGVGFWVRWW